MSRMYRSRFTFTAQTQHYKQHKGHNKTFLWNSGDSRKTLCWHEYADGDDADTLKLCSKTTAQTQQVACSQHWTWHEYVMATRKPKIINRCLLDFCKVFPRHGGTSWFNFHFKTEKKSLIHIVHMQQFRKEAKYWSISFYRWTNKTAASWNNSNGNTERAHVVC